MTVADVPRVSFGVAPESSPRGLRVELGALGWVGVLGPHARGERVELRVEHRAREGASEFDWLVEVSARLPLPGPVWLDVATHLWSVDEETCRALVEGRRACDDCLRLALEDRAPKSSAATMRTIARESLHHLTDATRIGDVRVGRGDEVFFIGLGPASSWLLAAGRHAPLHARAIRGDEGRPYLLDALEGTDREVLAAIHDADSHRCRLLPHAIDGDFDTALELAVDVTPVAFFRAEGLFALVGSGGLVAMPADPPGGPGIALPLPKLGAYAPAKPHRIGRFITSGTTERRVNVGWSLHEFGWVDLRGEYPNVPLETHGMPTFMRVVDDALYFLDDRGLWIARGGEPARLVHAGYLHGACIVGNDAWVGDRGGGRTKLVRLSLADGSVVSRTDIGLFPATIERVGRVVVVSSTAEVAIVDDEGSIVAATDARREGRLVRTPDGTTFVNAGEELIVLAPDGSLRRRRTMSYDGCLEGVTREHAVYAGATSGWERVAPDRLHLLDAQGSTVAAIPIGREEGVRLPHHVVEHGLVSRSACVGDDHLLLVEDAGRTLVRHRIGTHDVRATDAIRTSWLAPARHDESKRGGVTYSPRDDWPEAGLTVRGHALFATGSTYGGTTGVAEGPAIEALDGAVVVLVDCDLCEGGLELAGAAVVVLFRCRFGNKPWSLGRAGRVLVAECSWTGRIPVTGGDGCAIHHDAHALFERFASGGGTLSRLG